MAQSVKTFSFFQDLPRDNPSRNCGEMICKNKYQLPISFTGNNITIDLGRIVSLNHLKIAIRSFSLVKSCISFPNLTLQFKSFQDQINSTDCFFTEKWNNSDLFGYNFSCGQAEGRILIVTIDLPTIDEDSLMANYSILDSKCKKIINQTIEK